MHPQAIYASMGRTSMVGCKVQPDSVNNAGAWQVQDIEGLSIAFIEVVGKLSQQKHLFSTNC